MRRLYAAFGIYCAGFCAAFNRSAEMGVGNLKVVLVGHGFRVAQPCSRYVDRVGSKNSTERTWELRRGSEHGRLAPV